MSPTRRVVCRALGGRPFGPFTSAEILLGILIQHSCPDDFKHPCPESRLNIE